MSTKTQPWQDVATVRSRLAADEERARRYLARRLPHGLDNPAIFFNACGVLTELGEIEETFEQLRASAAHGFNREMMRKQLQ